MFNKELAKVFKLTAQLMELHDENPFKIKSYTNAAFQIDRSEDQLSTLSLADLEKVNGIGKSIAAKIVELNTNGSFKDLELMLEATPKGILDILNVKGIGPKKVRVLWKDLGIETIGELLYACEENRLVELKGFGEKTQAQVKSVIEFTLGNSGKFHFAALEPLAIQLVKDIKKQLPDNQVSLTGEIRRKCEILTKIELIIDCDKAIVPKLIEALEGEGRLINDHLYDFTTLQGIVIDIHITKPEEFIYNLYLTTGVDSHIDAIGELSSKEYASEEALYKSKGLAYIEPELREGLEEITWAKNNLLPNLVELKDLKGILHNHSTYSDGIHSLEAMAVYCKELGYEYLGICDHSQSAFYANGLKPERVMQQHAEIDELNKRLAPFKIFKGIESDILNDGSLDYEDLKSFDFIVASVHSNLKMNEEKATQRLLKAIENPYTTILGHPTGRLLLAREGYPIDHKKVIDACAEHNVVIELNAHPYRLDLDWRWIQYALSKGVMISINPDAHKKEGYHDIYYGVCVARKGALTADKTFNALNREQIGAYFTDKKHS
jgi:DNA polymerase (family 10)